MYNIVYTDNLPQSVGGRCEYPIIPLLGTCTIKIRRKYKNDLGLLNHELEHYRQYSINPFHVLMYDFIESYRYKCELKAYSKQIEYYKYTDVNKCEWIVQALLNKYNLRYNYHKIKKDVIKVYYGLA